MKNGRIRLTFSISSGLYDSNFRLTMQCRGFLRYHRPWLPVSGDHLPEVRTRAFIPICQRGCVA